MGCHQEEGRMEYKSLEQIEAEHRDAMARITHDQEQYRREWEILHLELLWRKS